MGTIVDVAAVCSLCDKATTGKIYSPYLCADCKVNDLEKRINEMQLMNVDGEKYKQRYLEEQAKASENLKYKWAFQTLVKELADSKK
jgi:hypothetical protein